MATLIELTQRVITRLSMIPGPAVQLYAEDRIAEMIYHKFVVIRDELWWDDLMEYMQVTLDANGRPVDDIRRTPPLIDVPGITIINKYQDIQHAWADGQRDPMPRLPGRTNVSTMWRGSRPVYRGPDQQKVIRFYPAVAGASVLLRYKTYVPFPQPDGVLPFDEQALILGACYDYLEDDGSNPSQIEKFLNLYAQRVSQLKSQENSGEIPLSPVGWTNSDYQVVS